jgi:hypothetical protein
MLTASIPAFGAEKVRVTAEGMTSINEVIDGAPVSVKIETQKLEIEMPRDGTRPTNSICTYSRIPCSLTKHFFVAVAGSELFVPRSVYSDLADIDTAQLLSDGNGKYQLVLVCGDASEAYTVELSFSKKAITRRRLRPNFDKRVVEDTRYYE